MSDPAFGQQPSVLRCSRCGRFVDWAHARLQIVCDCRGQLGFTPVLVRSATLADRERIQELFLNDFGRLTIMAFGEATDVQSLEALVAELKDDVAGALVFRRLAGALHLVAMATDPMWQRSGVGGYLLADLELLARREGLSRIVSSTGNDNLPSLYFFQRHGFRLTQIVPDAYSAEGSTAPGFAGIHALDEVRMEKRLS